MTDHTLRQALEAELAVLPIMRYDSNEYPTQALAKARLLDLLAMHPAESAPRPVIDREAVRKAAEFHLPSNLSGRVAARGVTDAVMELARPMPTREQFAEALREACSVDSGRTVTWEDAADAVLALLNGSES